MRRPTPENNPIKPDMIRTSPAAVFSPACACATGGTGGSGDYTSESYNYDTTSGNLSSKTGVGSYSYVAQASGCLEGQLPSRPHAVVTTVGTTTTTYCYDKNGNMTRRDPTGTPVYNFQNNAENQMTGVSGTATASFVYDGDGQRVKSTAGGVTTAHVGAYFEWTGSTGTMKKYYSAGGARVAVRTGTSTLNFMLTDHLGSTSVTTDSGGALGTDNCYKAWGESRYASGTLPTKFTYTGQYSNMAEFGLMFYGARWYDSALSRFTSADSIIPQGQGVQAWDRYAYANNNAIRYNDPSGHAATDDGGGGERMPDYMKLAILRLERNPLPAKIALDLALLKPTSSSTSNLPCSVPEATIGPTYDNLQPHDPDYVTISGSTTLIIPGVPLAGSFTIDRYSNMYLGGGLSFGSSYVTGYSGAITGGWVGLSYDENIPSEPVLEDFLTGLSVNGSLGAGPGFGITVSPFASGPDKIAHETGLYTPQGGVNILVSGMILNR